MVLDQLVTVVAETIAANPAPNGAELAAVASRTPQRRAAASVPVLALCSCLSVTQTANANALASRIRRNSALQKILHGNRVGAGAYQRTSFWNRLLRGCSDDVAMPRHSARLDLWPGTS